MVVAQSVSQRYTLGPVKPWVENAAYLIGPQFGIKTIYGWRQSDPFPDHPSGHALDFMTPSKAAGDALVSFATANASALGIKYIIWYRQYWEPGKSWVPYTSTTNPHTDHVHITFLDSPGSATGGGPGGGGGIIPIGTGGTVPVASTTPVEECAWGFNTPSTPSSFGPIPLPTVGGDYFCLLSKVQVRTMLGVTLMVGGAIVGVVGAVLLVAYGVLQTPAGKLLPGGIKKIL